MIIYKITNTTTLKVYVGQTVQVLNKRWIHHKWKARNGKKSHLYDSMRKYGIGAFSLEVLETLPEGSTLEQFNAREVHWIATLNSLLPNGYNCTSGGDGKFYSSEETKAKISKAKKGHVVSQKTKDLISEALTGSIGPNLNREFDDEWRAAIGAAGRGRLHSEETKKKMSEVHKARLAKDSTRSPKQLEALAKMQANRKGKAPWNKKVKS